MNILQRIKNQLKSVIDKAYNNYEAKIKELEETDRDALESYENYDLIDGKYKKARLDADGTAKPLTHIIAHYNYPDIPKTPREGQGAHAYEFKNQPIDGYVSINDKTNDDYTEEGIFKDWHTIHHKCKDGDGLIHIDDDHKIGIRTPEQDKIHREK